MLQTTEEMKKVDMKTNPVINGVDNPNLYSVDSTAVIETPIDQNPGETMPASKEEEPKKEASPADGKKDEKKEGKTEEGEGEAKAADKDAVQKRINELTRKFRSAERELNYERKANTEKIEQLKSEIAELKGKLAKDESVAPNRDDFSGDEEYYIALADWRFDQKVKEMTKNAEPAPKKEEQNTSEVREIDKVLDAGTAKHEDFDELVHAEDFAFTKEMADIILQSETEEVAADILYHLSKNLELAEEVSKMTPAKMAREIGKIEILVNPKGEPKKEEQKTGEPKVESPTTATKLKAPQTPEPITPVRTTGTFEKDPASMSMKEYRAWRNKNKE